MLKDPNSQDVTQCNVQLESIAFAEVISYIEDVRASNANTSVFKLSEIIYLYVSQLSIIYPIPDRQRPHAFQRKITVQFTRSDCL